MSEVPPVKLTKRQKKAIAHRSGGASASRQDKKKAKKAKLESLSGLPEEDHGAEDGLDEGAVDTVSEGKASQKAKGKQKADETTDTNGDNTAEQPKKKKSRLICFCGNLPYTVTRDQLAQYFTHEGNIPRVRLLTTKATSQEEMSKSKGYAFLEFTSASALQHALKLHHSTLGNRKINVELSAGGGGNSAVRKAKIEKARNKLNIERNDKIKKTKAKKEESKEAKAREKADESKASVKKRKREEKDTGKASKKPWLSGANAMKLG